MKKYIKKIICITILFAIFCTCFLQIRNHFGNHTFEGVLRKCGFSLYLNRFYRGEPDYYPNLWSNSVKKGDDTLFSASVRHSSDGEISSATINITDPDNKFYGCKFYIFASDSEAEEAFEEWNDSFYDDGYESGSNYKYGKVKVFDAARKSFIYLTRNMLIQYDEYEPFAGWSDMTEKEYQEWYAKNYSEKAIRKREKKNESMHKKIMNTWK